MGIPRANTVTSTYGALPFTGPGLIVVKPKLPDRVVGQRPKPVKVYESRSRLPARSRQDALLVGLPDLDQRVGNGLACAIQHRAVQANRERVVSGHEVGAARKR